MATSPTHDLLSEAILTSLRDGPKRLNRLVRELGGASRRDIALLLVKLVNEGWVESKIVLSIPARVTYELTDAAQELSRSGGTRELPPKVASASALRAQRKRN